nr:hypothetical protein Iba_chr10aCG8400 [Ipomoea batatas]
MPSSAPISSRRAAPPPPETPLTKTGLRETCETSIFNHLQPSLPGALPCLTCWSILITYSPLPTASSSTFSLYSPVLQFRTSKMCEN